MFLRFVARAISLVFLTATLIVLALGSSAQANPAYVDLEPAFILNYGTPQRIRYVQTTITLRVEDQISALEVTTHTDAIRHAIIMLFSRQPPERLLSIEGRDLILEEALRVLQDLLVKETGKPHIDRVLFTSYIVQS